MNILYIWDADYPWDVRVEKICNALHDEGYNVHIASRNIKRLPVYEQHQGLHIHRLKTWSNNSVNYFLSFPLFFSPVWRMFLHRLIRNNDINLVIVRDLPMTIAGIWVGRKFKIPVIMDMAEDYTAMIRDIWKSKKYHGFNLIVRNPTLATIVERYSFKHIDHILVVVDEAIDVVQRGGGDVNKITIVSNTPQIDCFIKIKTLSVPCIESIKNHYSIIYTGGIQLGRGIQTVIDSIEHIALHIPEFLFVVVGEGYATDQLKAVVQEKGIEKYVKWIGWVNHADVFEYIKACRIGVIPHLVTDHINTTIPNKIFDYMGCGVAVVSSDANPMKRVIDSELCGRTFKSGDAQSLSHAILEIYDSDINYGENGRNSVTSKYNWSKDAKRLLELIRNMS